MSDTNERRRGTDATWFRLLDRFGLPTLFAVVLLAYFLRQGEADRLERRELLGRLAASIDAQTVAFRELALEERQHAAAVAASPLQLRAPRLTAVHPPRDPESQE